MAELQITIDDGPEPVGTALSPMLAELKRRGLICGFFVLGQEVQSTPAAARSIAEAGHVLGNHSFSHLEPVTSALTDEQVKADFRRAHEAVKAATGVDMVHWRAPRIQQVDRLSQLLVGSGKLYTMTHNDFHADSKDSQGVSSAAAMLASIKSDISSRPGRTFYRLLFHVLPHTAAALRAVLDGLEADKHKLVRFAQAL